VKKEKQKTFNILKGIALEISFFKNTN